MRQLKELLDPLSVEQKIAFATRIAERVLETLAQPLAAAGFDLAAADRALTLAWRKAAGHAVRSEELVAARTQLCKLHRVTPDADDALVCAAVATELPLLMASEPTSLTELAITSAERMYDALAVVQRRVNRVGRSEELWQATVLTLLATMDTSAIEAEHLRQLPSYDPQEGFEDERNDTETNPRP